MTTIQIRTKKKRKADAMKILKNLGLDMSTAINIYLVQIIEKGGIPFEVLTENGMTIETERQILKEAEEARNSNEVYSSAEEMHDAIMAE